MARETEKMKPLFEEDGQGKHGTEKMKPLFTEEEETPRLHLTKTETLQLEGDLYTVHGEDPDSYIDCGGEAVLYVGEKTDGTRVALKIYDMLNQNEMRIHERLSREFCKRKADEVRTLHLMPVLDCGRVLLQTEDGPFAYFAEALPYLPDARLTRCTYEELRDRVIPHVLQAIESLHSLGLVHRDIKPENLFYYDKDTVVLSDFGASRKMDRDDANYTQKRTGTPGYIAPEVYTGFAEPASDYYSFGVTIATLYKGKHVFQELLDAHEYNRLSRKMHDGLPLDCPKKERALQELVDELTAPDPANRAGADRVREWLNDPSSFHCRRTSGVVFYRSSEGEITSRMDLAEYLTKHWVEAREALYRGVLKDNLTTADADLAVRVDQLSEKYATEPDLGVALALHEIYPDGPLCWKGKTYESAADLSDALQKNPDDPDIGSMLASSYISEKLSRAGEKEDGVLAKVREIEEVYKNHEKGLALRMMRIAFAPDEEGRSVRGAKTLDELFAGVLNQQSRLYDEMLFALRDTEFLAFLAVNGHKENVLELRKEPVLPEAEPGKTLRKDLLRFYGLADACMTDTRPLCESYLSCGPQSDVVWIKKHMDSYRTHSREAEKLKKEIQNAPLSEKGPLGTLRNQLNVLENLEQEFLRLFQGNPILASGLVLDGKTGVTGTDASVYYADGLFGDPQPIGYLKKIRDRVCGA